MKYKRLLLTINICLCSLFSAHRMYSQTPNEGVSIWAIAGPNHSVLNKSDLIDNYLGVTITPKPGWHIGVDVFIPFKLPKTKNEILLISSFELTQINFQFEQTTVPNSASMSNSLVYTTNIGLGKYFRLSDKFGLRFSIQQGIYSSKMNKDCKEDIFLGSNKFELTTLLKVKNRRVSIGFSGFVGPQSFFDLRNETWCLGKLPDGRFLENKFRAIQLDLGMQLWKSKK